MIIPFKSGGGCVSSQTGTAAARILALVLAFGAVSCAPRDRGALTPVEVSAPGASSVDILVATTRARSDLPGMVFNGERGNGLSFTDVVVSIPPDRPVGSIQWPQQAIANPAKEFAVTSLSDVPRSAVPAWFKNHAVKKHRVLVFVHGFNTRFDASVFRFAQIVHDAHADVTPMLFSWPSRGEVLEYVYDRESTNFSRNDLTALLRETARSPDVSEIIVMAHSMGAWLAVESIRQLALQDGRVPTKITDLVLAAPDLDIDVFRRQVAEMGRVPPRITIFVSRQDRALSLSSFIAGGVTRVGAVDMTNPAYVAELEKAPRLTVVDLSALTNGDALNHSKFAVSPEVVQLLGEGIRSSPRLTEEETGGGVGAAQALGSAVGAVVAAPILVFTGGERN